MTFDAHRPDQQQVGKYLREQRTEEWRQEDKAGYLGEKNERTAADDGSQCLNQPAPETREQDHQRIGYEHDDQTRHGNGNGDAVEIRHENAGDDQRKKPQQYGCVQQQPGVRNRIRPLAYRDDIEQCSDECLHGRIMVAVDGAMIAC